MEYKIEVLKKVKKIDEIIINTDSDEAIQISKKASYWNKCFDNTFNWIIKNEKDLYAWEKKAKESLAVAVCNGAVHEPKFKLK